MLIHIVHDKATFRITDKNGLKLDAKSLKDFSIKLTINEAGELIHEVISDEQKAFDEFIRLKDMAIEIFNGLKKAFDIKNKM